MAWTRIAHTTKGAAIGNHKTITTDAIDTTGADLIVAVCAWFPGAGVTATITSNKAGTYTSLGSTIINVTDSRAVRMYFAAAPTVGSGHTFTLANATTDVFPAISIEAWSGSHASPQDQQTAASSASASTLATGSITPSQNGTLIIAGLMNENNSGGARSIGSGFTLGDGTAYNAGASEGVHIAYLEQGTAAAINPTWNITNAAAIAANIASFKAAVVAGSTWPGYQSPFGWR